MGFSDSKLLKKIDPTQKLIRKFGLNWGNVTHKIRQSLGLANPVASSARSYQNANSGDYRASSAYHLDTRYRSLAELTGTKS